MLLVHITYITRALHGLDYSLYLKKIKVVITIITYILLIYNISDIIILILIYTKIGVFFKTYENLY